jgi:NitT/TauT family transport system ATP-binding protein
MSALEPIHLVAPPSVHTPRCNFDAGPRPAISIRGMSKHFGGSVLYDKFDLDIPKGAFISIFGPNGCGKSTLINLISGLIPIDGGNILFDGRDVKDVTIGYVFQNYRDALFPWMSVRENIEYPLKVRGWDLPKRQQRLDELIAQFEVKFDLSRRPYELSGGQQQLVSILRALAPKPEVMFLDEPFSALDYEMTLFIREKLQTVFQQTGVTMLLVSHDLEEAVYLADHVLLLTKRPTSVADIVEVTAARPRDDSTLSDPDFIATKARSLAIFQREVRR